MLEAGTIARFKPGAPEEQHRFWRMPPARPRTETLAQAAERLRGVLDESIALHALADAPVGAFLSGGVDSTAITAVMRKHISDLRTYTLRLPELPGSDESGQAQETARALGCELTVVETTGDEVARLLPRFARDLDQPSIDGLNTWLISRAAAADVKGVLSGLGGDEWFAGYPVTRRMAFTRTGIRGRAIAAAGALASVARRSPRLASVLGVRAANLAARRSSLALWLQTHTVLAEEAAARAAGVEPRTDLDLQEAMLGDASRESPLGVACLLDVGIYMGHQLLRDSDATSMASSLELRVPFVDVKLAEFSRTCADAYKLSRGGGTGDEYHASGAKRVLLEAVRDLLPPGLERRPKRGFALPYTHWLDGPFARIVADTTSPEVIRARGLLDPEVPVADRWSLMILELWCRATLDARPAVHGRRVSG
jgi:asparagine synthase (glutamine-hydrolysing)